MFSQVKRRHILVGALVLSAVGYGTGRYLQPAKVEVKEIEVVKEVEVVKRDVVTVVKEVVRPDGTRETQTRTEDRTRETSRRQTETETSKVVIAEKPQWRAQGLVKLNNITQPVYGAGIERRIFGPISAGVWGTTDRDIGVSVSFEF